MLDRYKTLNGVHIIIIAICLWHLCTHIYMNNLHAIDHCENNISKQRSNKLLDYPTPQRVNLAKLAGSIIIKLRLSGTNFVDWWQKVTISTLPAMKQGTSLVIMLTAWWIWKQRSAVVFGNGQPNVASLLVTIQAEARQWELEGASRLAVLLPPVLRIF